MKTKIFFILLSLILAVSTILVGCTGSSSPAEPETTTPAEPETTAPAEPETTAPAPAEKIILKLSHEWIPVNFQAERIDEFAAKFNELAGGQAEISVYGSGTMGMVSQNLEMVRTGAVEIAEITLGQVATDAPIFNIPGLPFLFSSADARDAALAPMAEAVFNDVFETQFNQKPICWLPIPMMDVGSSNRPIKTLEDWEGELVGMSNPAGFLTIQSLGGVPVNVAPPELYGALEKGIADAIIMPTWGAIMTNAYEILKYWTVAGMSADYACLTVNLDAFNKLPADIQELLVEEGKTLGADLTARSYADEMAGEDKLAELKVEIYNLPAEEQERWRQACRPIWDETITKAGDDAERLIAIAEEYNAANP